MKKILFALTLLLLASLLLVSCGCSASKSERYEEAIGHLENGKFEKAYKIFSALGDYKDAKQYVDRFIYIPASAVFTVDEGDDVATTRISVSYGKNDRPTEITIAEEEETETVKLTYDRKGNITQILEIYDEDDRWVTDISYDADGNVIREIHTDPIGGISKYVYTYDENGNLIREVYTNTDGEDAVRDYTYDAVGNRIREVFADNDGSVFTYDYVYDASGRLIREIRGENSYDVYTYDENGNLILELYHYGEGRETTYEYAYDAKGNLIRLAFSDYGGYSSVAEYTYDENERLIEESWTESPSIMSGRDTYAYDAAGRLVRAVREETLYGETETIYSDYTYDAKGNVTGAVHTGEDPAEGSATLTASYRLFYFEGEIPDYIDMLLDELEEMTQIYR